VQQWVRYFQELPLASRLLISGVIGIIAAPPSWKGAQRFIEISLTFCLT